MSEPLALAIPAGPYLGAPNGPIDRSDAALPGGTEVLTGRGRMYRQIDVVNYRDMVVIVRDRVQTMMKAGATLDQIKAARVTADYDTRYGANTGPWTTAMFIEAVYNSLKQPPVQKK